MIKKITIYINIIIFSISLFGQEQKEIPKIYEYFGVYPGSMQVLNFYVEYATGDLTVLEKSPKSKRFMENFDTKLSYIQTLNSAPWLGFGFIFQAQYDNLDNWNGIEGNRPSKNISNPFSLIELTANAYLLNTFSFGLTSSGDFVFLMHFNKKLPGVSVFKSHSITIMAQQNIYLRGNQYNPNSGALTQGWYDGSEFRLAYQMRFNDWFAIRPEIQFKILSIAQTDFNKAYWIRFNPRLQFFLEEWTLFIEPRLFYGGVFKQDLSKVGFGYSELNKDGLAFELKVGIDLTKIILN